MKDCEFEQNESGWQCKTCGWQWNGPTAPGRNCLSTFESVETSISPPAPRISPPVRKPCNCGKNKQSAMVRHKIKMPKITIKYSQ